MGELSIVAFDEMPSYEALSYGVRIYKFSSSPRMLVWNIMLSVPLSSGAMSQTSLFPSSSTAPHNRSERTYGGRYITYGMTMKFERCR